jgi:hypothetical protein
MPATIWAASTSRTSRCVNESMSMELDSSPLGFAVCSYRVRDAAKMLELYSFDYM